MQKTEFHGVGFSACDIMSVLRKFQILEDFRFFGGAVKMLDLCSNRGNFNAKIEKQFNKQKCTLHEGDRLQQIWKGV